MCTNFIKKLLSIVVIAFLLISGIIPGLDFGVGGVYAVAIDGGADLDNAVLITEQTTDINVSLEGSGRTLFKFVPLESGEYNISLYIENNTFGGLFQTQEQLDNGTDEDGYLCHGISDSGELTISCLLSDGEIYYLNIKGIDSETQGSLTFDKLIQGINDVEAPTIENATIYFSNITDDGVDLRWENAEDDITIQENLQYKVVHSTSNNINTVDAAEENGVVEIDWTNDLTNAHFESLIENTEYYFNVLVKDESENKSAYTMVSQFIASDEDIVNFSGGNGSEERPFKVSTAEELNNVRNFSSKFFIQTKDIDLSIYSDWVPIGNSSTNFSGSFNGAGYQISNLRIDDDNSPFFSGLFGIVDDGGVISNVNLVDINIDAYRSTNVCVGGLVAFNKGDIYNCDATGEIIAKGVYIEAGGLVGRNGFNTMGNSTDSIVEGCESNCTINVTAQLDSKIGGLIGSNQIGASRVSNNKSDGSLICMYEQININSAGYFSSYAGGLIGNGESEEEIENCESDTDISISGSDYAYIGGIVGYSRGSIAGCQSSGNLFADNNDIAYAGGLFGYSAGTGKNYYECKSSSVINITGSQSIYGGGLGGYMANNSVNKCYSDGSVYCSGDTYCAAGGLLGYCYSSATVSNSYSKGNVETHTTGRDRTGGLIGVNQLSNIINCYSVGVPAVSTINNPNDSSIGGLVGLNAQGSIEHSYYDTVISGVNDTGKGEGRSSLEMVQQITFENWDFIDIWRICEGQTYPIFTWQPVGINEEIAQAASEISWNDIKNENDSMNNIIGNLQNPLPTEGINQTSIIWSVDQIGWINTQNGTVTRPSASQGDKEIHLYAEFRKPGGISRVKEFILTIKALTASPEPDNTPAVNLPTSPDLTGVEIFVNGKTEKAATSETILENNNIITIIKINDEKIEEKLLEEGSNAVVTIPVTNDTDVVNAQLNGRTVKNMESNEAVLEIKTNEAIYKLPALQLAINSIYEKLNDDLELKDIIVSISISKPSSDIVNILEDTANKNNYNIVVDPIDFQISCSYEDKKIEIEKFNTYVERMVAIPENVDPKKITTGIVLNSDGTFSHVPTTIIFANGRYYAKINSLTNSTYSVIWNPTSFSDMVYHWSKEAVLDMSSRLIISGKNNDNFEPDSFITRAEVADILVRALGLMRPGRGKDVFKDVSQDDWYYDGISLAYEYGIISGYGNDLFGPLEEATREQVMTMIAKAMNITKLNVDLNADDKEKMLSVYKDFYQAEVWSENCIISCVKAGLIHGDNRKHLLPKDYMTKAELAVIIRRLLQNSNLI